MMNKRVIVREDPWQEAAWGIQQHVHTSTRIQVAQGLDIDRAVKHLLLFGILNQLADYSIWNLELV